MVSWLAVILLLVEMLCSPPVVTPGRLISLLLVDYCCVMLILWLLICQLLLTSDEIRSAHFAMELLCLREHSWEFSNNSNNIACL